MYGAILEPILYATSWQPADLASTMHCLRLFGALQVGSAARSSIIVALAVSVALTVVMGGRYQRTRKFMPVGLAAVSSLAMSAGYLATGF